MTRALHGSGRIMIVAGTRPELIKLAPVVRALRDYESLDITMVSTAQQADLLPAFVGLLGVEVDYRLEVMAPGQSLNALLARSLAALDPVIAGAAPDLVVVQGDTTTALAGALAARMHSVPVAHIEAGLRTGDPSNPFPEESNRRLITHIASLHCAPTERNRDALVREGIDLESIFVTGNPLISAIHEAMEAPVSNAGLEALFTRLQGLKPIVLTTHRRESFGAVLERNLRTLRAFVLDNPDIALVAPLHPNPEVKESIKGILADTPRTELIQPLDYPSFIRLLRSAWLIISDSGGVQEEVATLGKPLLVLRSVTERPEALDVGVARLAGDRPGHLRELLDDRASLERWIGSVTPLSNPFGDVLSSQCVAQTLSDFLASRAQIKRLAV